jgi:DNA-binding winged helix-turn-helix (wHTH) protein/tetratricopeptide (TPR) repeat protein
MNEERPVEPARWAPERLENLPEFRFGPYRIVDSGRALLRAGEAVAVSPKALALLVELLRVPGRVVSKPELLEAVWPDSFVEEGNLTQSISVLRKHLAADYPDRSPIETLPRVGYRFREPVEIVFPGKLPTADTIAADTIAAQPPPANPPPLPPAFPTPNPKSPPRRHRTYSLAAICLILIVAAVFYELHRQTVEASHRLHRQIAVLGFRNLSADPNNSWLKAALQETLSTDLSAGSDLEVIPVDDVKRAEKELGVDEATGLDRATLSRLCTNLSCDEVVTGAYLVVGDNVRLDTHLLDARDGTTLASNSLTEPLAQLLPLIVATGQSVRASFGLPADGAASTETMQAMASVDPAAFAWYAKGLDKLSLYDGQAAGALLEKAIAADPKFALAHLEYAIALTVAGKEKHAAEEAQLAQSLSSGLPRRLQLEIQGRAQHTAHQFDQAAATYRTLAGFYPNDSNYQVMSAAMLSYAGHAKEAVAQLLPLMTDNSRLAHDSLADSTLADAYSMMGDWPASLAWALRGETEAQRRGAPVLYGRLLTTESQAELYMNQLPKAGERTQQALQIARKYDDRSGELRALNRLGQIETSQGRLPEARAYLLQALTLEASTGEIQRQIHTLSALGKNYESSGDHKDAVSTFDRELALATTFAQPEFTVGAELDVAKEQLAIGRKQEGLRNLKRVTEHAAAISDRQLVTEATEAINRAGP